MSAKKVVNNYKEEEKVHINQEKNNSQIIRYSKDFIKNLNLKNIKKENSKQNENEMKQMKCTNNTNNINEIKQKLKENLDSNLNSYILSTKAKEQKILELLEIINQYESQILSLNNQIMLLTNNNKQMKEILRKMEFNYERNKLDLVTEREKNKNNNIQMNNLYEDKNICEKKIEELVNIINQYSGQIEALTETLNNIKNEFFVYKKQNELDKNKLIELNDINNILTKEKEIINDNYNILNKEFEIIKQEKENLDNICNKLNEEKKILNEQKEKMESLYEKEKDKSISLIDYINQDLKSLIDYFDNKFNSTLNKQNIKENKLILNCFQNIGENTELKKINFDIFIKALINGINSIIEKSNKDNENYQELINKEKKYIKEISELKEKIINNEKIMNNYNSNNHLIIERKYDNLKKEMKIKEIQIENMNKLIKIKDENIIKLKDDIKNLLEDNVNLIKKLEK